MEISNQALYELYNLVGYNNVETNELARYIYSYDASTIKAKPCGVIHIKNIELIPPVVKILYKHSIPFTVRASGTNLSGGATNQKGGFVINISPCNKIHQIDTKNEIAVVEPGVINIDLQNELKKFGYFYPPDPSSQKVCTIGGNIGENAGGPQCLKYGVTSNNVVKLDVVLADGEEHSFSVYDEGPQIMSLFIGSEGTLGIVKKAYLKIKKIPKHFFTIYSEFLTLDDSMKAVRNTIKSGIVPKAMEALDRISIELTKSENDNLNPQTQAIIISEIDGDDYKELEKERDKIIEIFKHNNAVNIKISNTQEESEKLFKMRKEAYPSLAKIANNVLVEDGCVPRSKLVKTVKEIKKIIEDYNLKAGLVFHAGDGNIHPNIVFDERDLKETNRIKKAAREILRCYILNEGTISAEHGVGVEKRAFMLWQYDKKTIEFFKKIKTTVDEKNISNPDKKIPVNITHEKLKRNEFEISDNVRLIINEIKKRFESKKTSTIKGSGSSLKIKSDDIISLADLNKVLNFDKDNMTITIESGIKIKTLKDFLRNEGFDINIAYNEGTIGGLVCENRFIGIRDLVLSMDLILSNGDFIRLGGKNIKDTSGYDLIKLMIGSMGTLAIITSLTLKISKQEKIDKEKYLDTSIKNITPLHYKIKEAFDPLNLLNPFLMEKLYKL